MEKVQAKKPTLPKVLIWDLETTDLAADFGHLLTAAAKWAGDKQVHTWRIDAHESYGLTPESMMDDRWIAIQLRDLITEADVLVHHYGDKFDLPFLNTRLLAWGEVPCPQVKTIDTWKVARSNLRLRSNRLGNLAELLNGPDRQKGGLSKAEWKLAMHGDEKTLDAMVDYNIGDVLATEEIYFKLRSLMKNHPYVAEPIEGKEPRLQCPACGSYDSQSTGSYYTKMFHVKRRRCNVCRTPWEESRSKKT